MQKMKEDDFLKLFDRWKEEEKEKLLDEMEKVKEMFMKEFKDLTSKNSALEYVSIYLRSSHGIIALRYSVSMTPWPKVQPCHHAQYTRPLLPGRLRHIGGRADKRNGFVMSGRSVQTLVQNACWMRSLSSQKKCALPYLVKLQTLPQILECSK